MDTLDSKLNSKIIFFPNKPSFKGSYVSLHKYIYIYICKLGSWRHASHSKNPTAVYSKIVQVFCVQANTKFSDTLWPIKDF